ncbi:hypothetical protein FMUBM48_10680 [Nocardia cyriacigeorgica]|nr:hypothetical protein FMUBM48_10680 [Nocardia cyriacigeorgica]
MDCADLTPPTGVGYTSAGFTYGICPVEHASSEAVGETDGAHSWRRPPCSAYRGDVRDHLPPGLPPDPFAGDPSDPSAALDAIEPGEPLDPHERLAVEEDLADLAVYEALLGHRGIRGLVVSCEDCRQDHYHDWDMLRANLLQLLVDGTVRPHEPAYDPTPEAYVTWDYCRGYADASMNEAFHGDGFDGFDS